VCIGFAALLARSERERRRVVAAFGGARPLTTVSNGRRYVKSALVLSAVAASFVAMARPLAGFRWEQTRHEGIDLMFAVDTSKSMGAEDVRPDRLTRAKLAVHDLLREFPGERVGLIAFAGDAFVQAPLTIDQAIFEDSLDALDTSVIPRGGTDIASAIRAAQDAMASEPDRRKVLVLLSDGEDLQGDALSAAKEAGAHGLVIYAVGIGTPAGELIPAVGGDGRQDLVRDESGQPVRSRLDEQTLGSIARSTGGAYASLGPSGRGLETLYRQHLAQLPRHTVEERTRKVYTERFQIPLAIAIGCLLVEFVLGERRRALAANRAPRLVARTPRATGLAVPTTVAAAVLLAVVGVSSRASAAEKTPAKPASAVADYNGGTSAYRNKEFAKAQEQFKSAMHTSDVALQEDAYYDLGNARFRLGQGALAHDQAATVEAWKSALAAYDGALALSPKDGDAKFNRDLVARRLAALQEQQKQQQQKQDQQKQGQQQRDKQGQQGKQNQQSNAGQNQQDKGGQNEQGNTGQDRQQAAKGGGAKPTPQSPPTARADQAPQPTGQKPNETPSRAKPTGDSAPRADRGQTPSPAAGGDERSGDAKAAPGALTRAEATQLLDSLHDDLRRMPLGNSGKQQTADQEAPIKDW
jgi:Ca-activated chloride channel family protein